MYASQLHVPYTQLSFTFDGETIDPSESADQLDLEDDFCIDVTGVWRQVVTGRNDKGVGRA